MFNSSSFGFGQNTQPTGFGSGFGQSQPSTFSSNFNNSFQPAQTGFGQSQFGNASQATTLTVNNGTGNPVWASTVDRDGPASVSQNSSFQAITAMAAYKNWSIEELRAQDYVMGKKVKSAAPSGIGFGTGANTNTSFGQPAAPSTGFGQPAAPSGFGQPAAPSGFGQAATASTGFGQTAAPSTGFGQAASTGFGQPAATGFGAPSTFNAPKPTTGFGFGSTPATQPTSLFGATTPAFGQAAPSGFGQPAQPTATGFGQPAQTPATTGFGFGATKPATTTFGQPATTAFGQPAQQPSTGMFGTTAPAQATGFGGFGQPSQPTTGFGQQPAQSTFNQKPATSGFGGTGFGGGATTTQTSGFGFGQQQQQPAAQPTTGFGFGAKPATTPAFGGAAPTAQTGFGGGLFGSTAQAAKPATSLFGGGATAQPSTTFGQPAATGGLFGNTQSAPTNVGLFGAQNQQPAPGFGQAQPSNSLFGGSAATPAKPTSLFGSVTNTAQPSTSTFGFGQSQGTTSAGLFGTSTAQPATSLFSQQPASNLQILHASLNKNPYGVNPLLQKSVSQKSQKPEETPEPANITAATPEKKLPTLTPTFKVTPRSSSQIKLRGVAPHSTGPSISESHRNQISSKKSLHILDGSPRDVVALGLDTRFTPRRSVKRLDIDDASVFLSTPQKEVKSISQTPKSVNFRSGVEDDLEAVISKPNPPAKGYILSPSIDELMLMSDEQLRKVKNFTVSIQIYGSVCFLEPVDLLSASPTKTRSGIASIPGEIIVITSHVVTVYPDDALKPPQGQGLNVPAVISLLSCWPKDRATNDIIDNESDPRFDNHIKKLMNMKDTTFIDFEIITGTWKFRVEHFTMYGLVDDSDEEISGQVVPGKVDESEVLDDTFMLAYRDRSIFKGVVGELLDESEPEELEDVSSESVELVSSQSGSGYESDTDSEEELSVSEETQTSHPNYVIEAKEGSSAEDDEDFPPAPEILQAAMPTVDRAVIARNVQTMKASLFQSPKKILESPKAPISFSFKEEDTSTEGLKAGAEKRVLDQVAPSVVANRTEFSSLQILKNGSPKKYLKQTDLIVAKVDLRKPVKLVDSSCFGNEKLIADASFHMGRSFRACFGPNGTIVIPKSMSTVKIMNIEAVIESQSDSIRSAILLESILANTKVFMTIPSSEDPRNEIQVDPVVEKFSDNHSVISSTSPSTGNSSASSRCPKSVLNPSFNFEMICQTMSAAFSDKEIEIWKLARDLWDRIPLDQAVFDYSPQQLGLIELALRRTRVSQWLKEAVESIVTDELAKAGKSGVEKVYWNLTGNRIAAAIESCFKNSDFRLACVLAQLPTPIAVSAPGGLICPSGIPGRKGLDRNTLGDLLHQINYWNESRTAKLVDPKYLAIWTLLSGAVDKWDESIFQKGMDWKRTFGLFLWYSDGGNLSLSDSVAQYAANLDAVAKPVSLFDPQLYDLLFHMLQLSSDPDHSLEETLDPLTHTKSPLDYRISWTLGMFLTKLVKVQQFKDIIFDSVSGDGIEETDGRSSTQDNQALHFISQLLASGLWKWAIFVATFLSFHTSREGTIREILNRHYPLEDCSGSIEKDSAFEQDSEDFQFLTQKLYICPQWIHESRALRASYGGDIYQNIVSLIDAKYFNKAHLLLVTEFAPKKILSNETGKLSKLLGYFEANETSDWKRGGGFLKTYLALLIEFPDPYATLGANAEKADIVNDLLGLVSKELLSHWLSQAPHATAEKRQLLIIFMKEAAKYLSTLQQSLGTEKMSLDILCNLPLRVEDRARFVTNAAMGLIVSQ